jgi:hypothetical protein
MNRENIVQKSWGTIKRTKSDGKMPVRTAAGQKKRSLKAAATEASGLVGAGFSLR